MRGRREEGGGEGRRGGEKYNNNEHIYTCAHKPVEIFLV